MLPLNVLGAVRGLRPASAGRVRASRQYGTLR